MRDGLETCASFQADLHIANAINFIKLGYNTKEAFDFLH